MNRPAMITLVSAIAVAATCASADDAGGVGLLPLQSSAPNTASVATVLSPEVQQNIEFLRRFGDRFEDVIRQIEAENAKPSWGHCDCSDTSGCDQPVA